MCLLGVYISVYKYVESFDKVVDGFSIWEILEEIWTILEIISFGCKVGGCIISKRLQKVFHEVLHELVSNNWFEWKQREELTEVHSGGLYVWDENGRRVS